MNHCNVFSLLLCILSRDALKIRSDICFQKNGVTIQPQIHTEDKELREFTENKIPNFKIIPSYYKVL
jgi:hypothetical protein